jgi:hypothetical protein
MPARYIPIRVPQGADLSDVVFRLWEPPVDPLAEPDTPIDLTGWSLHGTVRSSPDASSAVLEWTTGQFDIDAPYGLFIPIASASVIAALAPFVGWYDVFATDPNGHRHRTHFGEFEILASSTRVP